MKIQSVILFIVIFYILWFYLRRNNRLLSEENNEDITSVIEEIVQDLTSVAKRIIPIPTSVMTNVWTYIEPISKEQNVHLHTNPGGIPSFFQLCIDTMKKGHPDIIILTPGNISDYIDDFPIAMNYDSEIPLRRRVDLLFSFILERHGGVCLSPGTIVRNIDEILHQSSTNDIVSCGTSPRVLGPSSSQKTPDTLVIGGEKGSPLLKEYKRKMIFSFHNTTGKLSGLESYDILSTLLQKMKPTQFHIGFRNNGTVNKYLQKIDVSVFLSKNKIDYSDKDILFLVSTPYEELLQKKYRWFLNLSKQELIDSDIILTQYLI